MKIFENLAVGVWVVVALTVLFTISAILTNSFDMSEGVIAKILGLVIGTFITLFAIYWIIAKFYPQSTSWSVVHWIIALIGIPVIIRILLVVVLNFFFGLGLRFW